jgi:hypothetical protein
VRTDERGVAVIGFAARPFAARAFASQRGTLGALPHPCPCFPPPLLGVLFQKSTPEGMEPWGAERI